MDIQLHGNRAQLPKLVLQAPCEVSIEGRGTGKSFDIGFKMDAIVRKMPRSVTALTGKTFGQLLTRTLPSSLKLLNQMGYQKDINYVIGRKPPSYFHDSYESINKYDNVISFSNGARFAMISQSEPGSGRGANVDYEIADETLTLDQEQYNNEVSPTNRGNLEFFGKKSKNPISFHHGYKFSSSMPINKEGRWVLDFAEYYKSERGIRLFDIWNRIVMQQVDCLGVVSDYRNAVNNGKENDAKDLVQAFRKRWNEIARLKGQITPFVSKEGVLFTLSNAFDNLDMLGMDYLLKNQKTIPSLIFMVEIMNLYYDKVEDCFYTIEERKHIYYNFYDNERLRGVAESKDYNFDEINFESSIYDRDCDTNLPIEVSFDWGSAISLMVVTQERYWDFVTGLVSERPCQTQINEFFVKPEGKDNVMIEELVRRFCAYYQHHQNKVLHFYKDKYGDHKNPAVLNSKTFNEMAIAEFERYGWDVELFEHKRNEPPMSDKFLLWGIILSENNDSMPRFRINGDKCKYTLISMNNAKVKSVAGKMEKDKSSERPSSGVLPEEATHFSDAIDKLMWTKWGDMIDRNDYDLPSNI